MKIRRNSTRGKGLGPSESSFKSGYNTLHTPGPLIGSFQGYLILFLIWPSKHSYLNGQIDWQPHFNSKMLSVGQEDLLEKV